MALGCLVLQALIGDAQLVLHLTPLFLIVSLLLSGHYVAEDRIVEARLALRPRPRRAPRAPRPAGRELALASLLERSPQCRRGPPAAAAARA